MTVSGGNYCRLYEPVSVDLDTDTPETVRAVMRNNAVWVRLCE